MGISKEIGRRLAPQAHKLAPGLTTQFVHESLQRALDGVGPLPPAAEAADKQLAEQGGDIERAVHEVIENHVRYAGAQGFVTNLGGLATLAVALPANLVGLTLLQCRMVAGIAHLRGYDLDDPRVHNAVLACILGEDKVQSADPQEDDPGAADGDRHRARPRPAPRPADGRRGHLRAAHPGRRQARRHHGRPADPGGRRAWSARASTATPPGRSAATPTASCCRAAPGRPAAPRRPARCCPPRAPAAA